MTDKTVSESPAILDEVNGLVASERYYDALRKTQDLMDHETERLASVAG